ncbi:DUF7948 domain-containing protein [Hymenobacter crusticola]|uniref:PKD domain-containing protein n=1 Tax=Hymenobacter crusticola TaxID=1770526 RepID=A0A243WK24_9BACT|nr:PKD domain-containing protein [Hymenobacter crusticola]OUJ76245.1 hypothetical protein BXP70_03000 [Hymenobacter crusticola]
MRISTLVGRAGWLVGLLLASLFQEVPAVAQTAAKVVGPPPSRPFQFVANRNQWDKPVLFAADVPGGRLFMEQGRLTQVLYDVKAVAAHHESAAAHAEQRIKAHAYSVTFEGANQAALVQGEAATGDVTNYFIGNDPQHWASQVPSYGEVRYQELYKGTNLRFYTHKNTLEYDFELAPAADPRLIRLRYDGQQQVRVVDGALHIITSVGEVLEQRPYAYQKIGDRSVPVACEYALDPNGSTVSFRLPKGYNSALPLVIDPVLVYSTYSGSVATNWGYSATYDDQGNLYCGSVAFSIGYPTSVGAYSVMFSGLRDITITKFDPKASGAASRVYSTYLGGSGEEHPHSLLVDHAGNLLIYGSTSSNNFPTTAGAYSRVLKGDADIIVTKLNPTGTALVASTYLGGSSTDGQLPDYSFGNVLSRNFGDSFRGDITTDSQDNVYVASSTISADFPVVGGFQTTLQGPRDAVVLKLASSLGAIEWSTFLGGTSQDAAYSIQLDGNNNVFVSGGTTSTNFPGVTNGYKAVYQGGSTDGFVARITANGRTLTQATYLGTNDYDQAYFVQLDRQGEVYVYGQTSGAYPVTPGLYVNPNSRQFIHKLSPELTASRFSTVIGNGNASGSLTNISPTAFLVNDCGQILLSGYGAYISDMPTTPDAIQLKPTNPSGSSSVNGDFYLMQLSADVKQLLYGTYFGNGTLHVDGGASRFDKRGVIYQTVCSGTGSFYPLVPVTPNAWATTYGNTAGRNAVAFKLDVLQLSADFVSSTTPAGPRVTSGCAPLRMYFRPTTASGGVSWDFGNGQTSTATGTVSTLYTTPGSYPVRLTVTDPNGCLQSATIVDTIKVYGLPRSAAGADQLICAGSTTTLTVADAGPGVTYSWAPATGLNTTTGRTVIASPSATTTYIVTATVPNGCINKDTVVVRLDPTAQISLGPTRTICPDASVTLSVSPTIAGTFTWSPATGLNTTSGPSVIASPKVPTQYTVRANATNGCTNEARVQVLIYAQPNLAFSNLPLEYVNRDVRFLNTSQGATSYLWDFGDGQNSSDASPTHRYANPGTYAIKMTAFYGNGCQKEIAQSITIRDVFVPNIITPNDDGLNDHFVPQVSTQPVLLKMYNRWGKQVFENANYTGGWGDSTTPVGTYYYQILTKTGESWKGWLQVNR